VTTRLICVYELASNTSKLKRFIIFGSYVTAKADPNDVDLILIMHDDFTQEECTVEARTSV
jgi:predicted nucleotidyltransferase